MVIERPHGAQAWRTLNGSRDHLRPGADPHDHEDLRSRCQHVFAQGDRYYNPPFDADHSHRHAFGRVDQLFVRRNLQCVRPTEGTGARRLPEKRILVHDSRVKSTLALVVTATLCVTCADCSERVSDETSKKTADAAPQPARSAEAPPPGVFSLKSPYAQGAAPYVHERQLQSGDAQRGIVRFDARNRRTVGTAGHRRLGLRRQHETTGKIGDGRAPRLAR